MKKRAKKSFASNSKNAIFALLILAAAVTAYGITQAAVVSHPGTAITSPVAESDNSFLLEKTPLADILAATGGAKAVYTTKCTWSCGSFAFAYTAESVPTSCVSSCSIPACASGDTSLVVGCAASGGALSNCEFAPGSGSIPNIWSCWYSGYGYCERVCRDD